MSMRMDTGDLLVGMSL